MEEQAPVSLDLRTLKKKRRLRVGAVCLVLALVVLGLSAVGFLNPGAIVLGVVALAAGVALGGVGGYQLYLAKTSRW